MENDNVNNVFHVEVEIRFDGRWGPAAARGLDWVALKVLQVEFGIGWKGERTKGHQNVRASTKVPSLLLG